MNNSKHKRTNQLAVGDIVQEGTVTAVTTNAGHYREISGYIIATERNGQVTYWHDTPTSSWTVLTDQPDDPTN